MTRNGYKWRKRQEWLMAKRDGNGLKARNGCNGGKILKVSGMNGIDSR